MFRNTILLSLVLGVTVSTGAQTQPWKFRVEFEGNKIFSTDILLKELSSCPAKRSDLADRYDVGVFDYCLRKHVRDFLWTHGYITAEIGKPREQRDESGLEVIVPIDEGPRYRLGSISIRGEKYFTSKQLLEKLKLKSGDIADARELQEWLYDRLKRLYDDSGHVQSTFEFHPIFRPIPEQAREGVADIEVIVEEGRQYAIGRIEFIGNGETSDQILRDALLVKEDEIFRPSRLNEGVKKLNGLGLFSPIDKDNDVEFTVDEEIPAVKIYIRVKPKNQVNPE